MSTPISKPTDIVIPSNSLWAKLPAIGGVMAVVGLGATLAMAGSELKSRAMFSYLWAFEVVLALALGGLGFVLIEHVTRSGWSAAVRRVAETAMVTLPLFILLWLPIATIGRHELFPWTHKPLDAILLKKEWFLSEPFFIIRGLFYFAVWSGLAWFLYSRSVKQDEVGSDVPARDKLTRQMWRISAVGVILYALTQSFQAFDWLMSLQPHWYSTIFGIYFFAGSILAFYAFFILCVAGLQKAGVLKEAISAEHYHDLGKFNFGFTVFWAYIAFSQFVLIWYASIPEETEFYLVRLTGGWELVSYALPFLHFVFPFFFLMSRRIKRNPKVLVMAAIWTLLMHLLDFYWLVLPNFGAHGEGSHGSHLAPHWLDVAALVGMVGAFLAVFATFLKKNKVICINDPRLPESLAHENY